MSVKKWVMSDEWWVMEIEWRKLSDDFLLSKQALSISEYDCLISNIIDKCLNHFFMINETY